MPENEVSGEGKSNSALLTRKGRCPNVSPWLPTVDLWVHLSHRPGVTTPDLSECAADIVHQSAANCAESVLLFTEWQAGLAGPVAEREIRKELARECGDRGIVDAVSCYPEACGFQAGSWRGR